MIFGSFDRIPVFNTEEVAELSGKMLKAWASFAYSGAPGHDGLPGWLPFTTDCNATMVFEKESQLRVAHDSELIEIVKNVGGGPGVGKDVKGA